MTSSNNPKITMIIPAYNEEEAIGEVIDEIFESEIPTKILVGDNNSTDYTVNMCLSRGILPILVKEQGKGNVVRELIKHIDTPYAVMVNADFTYPLKSTLPVYLRCLEKYNADVVIGHRWRKENGAMSLTHSIGNNLLSWLASRLYGYPVLDVCCGLWGFKTETLQKFPLASEGFTLEVELFVNSVKHHCKILQVAIGYRARLNHSKPKLKVKHATEIGWFLLKNKRGKCHPNPNKE